MQATYAQGDLFLGSRVSYSMAQVVVKPKQGDRSVLYTLYTQSQAENRAQRDTDD